VAVRRELFFVIFLDILPSIFTDASFANLGWNEPSAPTPPTSLDCDVTLGVEMAKTVVSILYSFPFDPVVLYVIAKSNFTEFLER
jgi:hypothetical protein